MLSNEVPSSQMTIAYVRLTKKQPTYMDSIEVCTPKPSDKKGRFNILRIKDD